MNTGTVVIGLVLIVVGILTIWVFCLGFLLILMGFIIMIIGLIQSEPQPQVVYTYGPYGQQYTQFPQYQPPSGPPGTYNFCPYCGQRVPPGALSCPQCGRRLA